MSRSNQLAITPMTPTIGAVVSGVDLRDDHTDTVIGDLRAALLDHKVLFFEDQDLSPARQRDFALRFGELHTHPLYPNEPSVPEVMILDNHKDNPTDNDHWHTDVTFLERPAMGAILQCPPARLRRRRRHPVVASMTAQAWRALSPSLQGYLQTLSAVHDITHAFPSDGTVATAAGRAQYEKARADNPPVIHPVALHPSGDRARRRSSSIPPSPPASRAFRREESRAPARLPAPPHPETGVRGALEAAGARARWRSGTIAARSTTPSTTTCPTGG